MEKRLPQLYYIKMKISYDLGFIAVGVSNIAPDFVFTSERPHYSLALFSSFIYTCTFSKKIEFASLRCHGDSDCNKTQIIRNFHLHIIQLW